MSDRKYGTQEGEPKRPCDAVRIRSVYGAEFAGGYVGLMEVGSTAATGSLSVLGGVIKAENLLGALNAVYPTIENANVYGPLEQLDARTWNAWIRYVGQYGGFAGELANVGEVTDENVDEKMSQFDATSSTTVRQRFSPAARAAMPARFTAASSATPSPTTPSR